MRNSNKVQTTPRLRRNLIGTTLGIGALLALVSSGIFSIQEKESLETVSQSSRNSSQQESNSNLENLGEAEFLREESTEANESLEALKEVEASSQENESGSSSQSNTSNTRQSTQKNEAASSASAVEWAQTSFAVEANSAKLLWSTRMEKNVEHFEVLRSFDEHTFQAIARVDAGGTGTHQNQEYSLEDQELMWNEMPSVFYKIRTVGKDRNTTESDIIRYDFNLENGMYLKVEDMADGELSLSYAGDKAVSATLDVLDINGTLITRTNLDLLTTPQKLLIDISALKKGVHYLMLNTDDNAVTEMITIE